MQNNRQISPTAVAYAKALLALANERGQAAPVGEELSSLVAILDATPAFRLYLADPGIGSEEKRAELDKLFRGRASPTMFNFLGVMNEHGKLNLLTDAATAYEELLAEQQGIVEVDVTVAQRLSPEQLNQVQQAVGKALDKTAVVHQYVDESIIGGLILRVGDRLLDGSVKAQLQTLRERLLAAAPQG